MYVKVMKKDIFGCLFSVVFSFGRLCCYAVLFGLRQVVLCFAQLNGKYNITETKGFNITFALQKYHSDEVGISRKLLHLVTACVTI